MDTIAIKYDLFGQFDVISLVPNTVIGHGHIHPKFWIEWFTGNVDTFCQVMHLIEQDHIIEGTGWISWSARSGR